MQWKIKLTRWFVYEWGKPSRQKSHQVILRSPLPKIHYYHNKQLQVKESQYLIPTYSWTFTPIPNWTCSVVTISHFSYTALSTWLTNQCTDPSTWLTTGLRRMLAAKFFSSSIWWRSRNSLVKKTLRCTNVVASWREIWTRAYVSNHNMHVKNFCIKLHQL